MNKGFLNPFGRYRGGSRMLRGVGRGMRGMRGMRPRRYRRGCCCCPLILVLGFASLSLMVGAFYLGIRFLGWA